MPMSITQALISQDFVVIENFLSPDRTKDLRHKAQQLFEQKLFLPAEIGAATTQHLDQNVRGDHILWLEPKTLPALQDRDPLKEIFQQLHELQTSLNQDLLMNINQLEMHFARYPSNSPGYHCHLDQMPATSTFNRGERLLSFVIYLNSQWQIGDGGEFCVHSPDNKEILQHVEPKPGRAVFFLSDKIWHSVAPTAQERWSLTGWFRRDPAIITRTNPSVKMN